ncbi:hypothetical protein IC582_010209 [Cucumis melo]
MTLENSHAHQFGGNSSNQNGKRNNFNGCGRGRGRGNKPTCQVCGKYGHSALICYDRYNKEVAGNVNQNRGFNPNQNGKQIHADAFITTQKSSSLATPETVVDTNWYVDSGATNHVTSDHSNLWNIDDYSGQGYGSSTAQRNTM